MKNTFHLLLCLFLTSWATAAEIFAWKVPLSYFAWEGLDAPGVVRLESAPEKSPFFSEGDVLWDIRAAVPDAIAKAGASPEWAVWNATSKRIVAKGSFSAIYSLHYHLETESLPTHCRVKIDVFPVSAAAPPDFTAKPYASLTIATRSGSKSVASISEEGGGIELECDTTYYKIDIDSRIFLSITLADSSKLEIDTSTSLRDRSGVWLARDYDAKTGMDIRLTASIELLDGTPYSDVTLRQENGLAVPFRVDTNFPQPVAIGDGWLIAYFIGDMNFRHMFADQENDSDPFAATPKEAIPFPKGMAEVQVPEKLAPHFAGSVFDLSDKLKNMGLVFKEGDLAGYDPRSQGIFMYSTDKNELDKFEQLFCFMGCGSPNTLAITTRGNGEMMLIARSGQKASLKSTRPELNLTRELEVEPTMGESDIVDLRVLYVEKSGNTLVKSLNSSATLNVGKFAKLMEGALSDSKETNMEIKAEITEVR